MFIGAFVVHVLLKFPTMLRSLRTRTMRSVLRTPLADTLAEELDEGGLVAADPAPATISRRGALGFVAAASATLVAFYVGQILDAPWLRRTALLSPHDRPKGTGGNAFPVNKAAATAGVDVLAAQTWQLELVGPAGTVHLSRPQLMRMQHTASRPAPSSPARPPCTPPSGSPS